MASGSEQDTTGRFKDAIAQLQTRFVASLPERRAEINTHYQALITADDIAGHLDAIKQILHKTAGVAGSLGHADLGNQCSQLENRIAEFLSETPYDAPDEALFDEILQIQTALDQSFADASEV